MESSTETKSSKSFRIVTKNRKGRTRGYKGRIKNESVPEYKSKGLPEVSRSGVGNRSVTPEYSGSESGEEYSIDVVVFKKRVESLLPFAHVEVTDLPSDVNDKLSLVTHVTKSVIGTDLYDTIRKTTLELFSGIDTSKIRPNTVASKILGCTVSRCSGIPLGCGPLCAGALGSDDNVDGWSPCGSPVYFFDGLKNSVLTHGSGVNGKNAYVYVNNGKFDGFTSEQVAILKSDGVENVRVGYLNDQSECSHLSASFVPIERFQKNMNSEGNNPLTSSGLNWMWIVIVIVIILLVIAVAWLFYRSRHPDVKRDAKYNELPTRHRGSSAPRYRPSGMTPGRALWIN